MLGGAAAAVAVNRLPVARVRLREVSGSNRFATDSPLEQGDMSEPGGQSLLAGKIQGISGIMAQTPLRQPGNAGAKLPHKMEVG